MSCVTNLSQKIKLLEAEKNIIQFLDEKYVKVLRCRVTTGWKKLTNVYRIRMNLV